MMFQISIETLTLTWLPEVYETREAANNAAAKWEASNRGFAHVCRVA